MFLRIWSFNILEISIREAIKNQFKGLWKGKKWMQEFNIIIKIWNRKRKNYHWQNHLNLQIKNKLKKQKPRSKTKPEMVSILLPLSIAKNRLVIILIVHVVLIPLSKPNAILTPPGHQLNRKYQKEYKMLNRSCHTIIAPVPRYPTKYIPTANQNS